MATAASCPARRPPSGAARRRCEPHPAQRERVIATKSTTTSASSKRAVAHARRVRPPVKSAPLAAARGRSASNGARRQASLISPADRNERQRLKRLDLKRVELLRAAVRIFNLRGATNTSLEDVASELGLTKAALYYYFESKQEILYACYRMSLDFADAVIADAQRQGSTGCEKLELYIRRVIELGLSELQPTIGLRQQLTLEPEYLNKLVKRRRVHRDKLRAMIAEGVADGTVVDCNAAVLQSIIA